jgi:histidyl-tRNA synthetase
MEELYLFPENMQMGATAIFMNMGNEEALFALKIMQQLREKNISCELYPEPAKMDKQFKYANKKNIAYAIIIGSREITENKCSVKNLLTSTQEELAINELPGWLQQQLKVTKQ